jgi:FHA domain
VVNDAMQPGLWPIPGDGVLARQGDLVLLVYPAGGSFTDRLLDLLADSSRTGRDGRQFADLVWSAVDADAAEARADNEQAPAVVAFGPDHDGMAVVSYGPAWAEITTADGAQRLAAGQPYGRLRCVLPSKVNHVRAGLRDGQGTEGTDRYLRLADGMVRAVGLFLVPGPTAGGRLAEPVAKVAEPAPAVEPAAEPAAVAEPARPAKSAPAAKARPAEAPPAARPAKSPPAEPPPARTPAKSRPAAKAQPARAQPARPAAKAAAPATPPAAASATPPAGGRADRQPAQAAPDTGDHPAVSRPAQSFVSVHLGLDQPGAEIPPRKPLPLGSEPPDEQDADPAARLPPVVIGVYCKNGHFDDPQARYCAVCGIGMAQLTKLPRSGKRPPLGVLVLDDGSVFQLDADYVLGREPSLDSSVAGGSARPLRFSDAEVSRIHARVNLDGWQVLISDLNSANGTHLRLPGEDNSQRLSPGVKTPLAAGAHVRLGTNCGFRYDSYRHR